MKILMLGPQGAGKTTYLASLYGMMQQSVKGFRLKAISPQSHQRWLELAEAIRIHQHPIQSLEQKDESSEYAFSLRYQGNHLLHFVCANYPNTVLPIPEAIDNFEQSQDILTAVQTVDGILLFCDAETLINEGVAGRQLNTLVQLLMHTLQDLNRPIVIAIVLTKVDQIKNFKLDLIGAFNELIQIINHNSLLTGAFIPVSCSHPFLNIPVPLLFALRSAIEFQANLTKQLWKDHLTKAKFLEQKSQTLWGSIDWLMSKALRAPTYGDLAVAERHYALEKQQEFETLQQPAYVLEEYFRLLPIIRPDQTLADYVIKISQMQSEVLQDSLEALDPFWVFN